MLTEDEQRALDAAYQLYNAADHVSQNAQNVMARLREIRNLPEERPEALASARRSLEACAHSASYVEMHYAVVLSALAKVGCT